MTTKKTTNGSSNGRNGHVSLAREEYDAFMALEEKFSTQATESARLINRNVDLTQICDAQGKHLSHYELKTTYLERTIGLQREFIELLKDKVKVTSIEELSEFWHQWQVHTHKGVEARKLTREEVVAFEPDLFKMWRNWVNDQGKVGRGLNFAGTRAERLAAEPPTQALMQTHMLARQREENAKLLARVQQLEFEIETLKKEKQP